MAGEQTGITLLGLGPGDPNLLTRQAWELLQEASEIVLRTNKHPTVAGFPPNLDIQSFDGLYETAPSFEALYEEIIAAVLAMGARPQGVIYAVPGHPFVAEATAPEIARRARQAGLAVRIVEGLSFLEPAFAALGIDPFTGLTLVDALDVARLHVPPFPPDRGAMIAQLYSHSVAADVKLTLMEVYPDTHPVQLIHAAGLPEQEIEALALYQIDRSEKIGFFSTLYVPALGPATSFEAFHEVVAHLRAPEGCPWDREQTHLSLRPYLLEEAYEVLAALDGQESQALKEELGDLLLQIVLHAQVAAENGDFNIAEVLQHIHNKLVFRHPHVFGDLEVADVSGVLVNWERLKSEERAKNGNALQSTLDGVPAALPALVQAEQYQRRAARIGFRWPDIDDVLKKIQEEISEVAQAGSPEARAAELGDLLFAVVSLATWHNCDPESSLREANMRFRQRFTFVEQQARRLGKPLSELPLEQMLVFWQEAKGNDGRDG
jgi:tetrapyrrole methylase family protein / MazG family protein